MVVREVTALDLDNLTAETVESPVPDDDVIVPNHKATDPSPVDKARDFMRSRPAKAERPARAKKAAPRAKKGAFVEPLTQVYTGLGITLVPFDEVCGTAVLQSAEQCAKSLDELAYQNEAVRRALTALTQTSAMGAVLIAHLPIILAVAGHHMPRVVGNIPGFSQPAPSASPADEAA